MNVCITSGISIKGSLSCCFICAGRLGWFAASCGSAPIFVKLFQFVQVLFHFSLLPMTFLIAAMVGIIWCTANCLLQLTTNECHLLFDLGSPAASCFSSISCLVLLAYAPQISHKFTRHSNLHSESLVTYCKNMQIWNHHS